MEHLSFHLDLQLDQVDSFTKKESKSHLLHPGNRNSHRKQWALLPLTGILNWIKIKRWLYPYISSHIPTQCSSSPAWQEDSPLLCVCCCPTLLFLLTLTTGNSFCEEGVTTFSCIPKVKVEGNASLPSEAIPKTTSQTSYERNKVESGTRTK